MPIIELKNIPKLPVSFWNKIGQLAVQWIRADAKTGKMQTPDGNSNKPNYNSTYAKYKANDMRRFYKDTKKGRKSAFKEESVMWLSGAFNRTGFHKEMTATGQRLKSLKGQSVTSKNTSFVDMTLTGKMFRGLHVVKADNISVTLGYRSEDRMKVIGNRDKYNRDVANLNADNRAKVKQAILEQFNENIRKELKDITINVRF